MIDAPSTPYDLKARLDEEPILRFFSFSHLTGDLQEVSSWFAEIATKIVVHTPRSPERTVALRKLLEAKDAAVRNMLPPL